MENMKQKVGRWRVLLPSEQELLALDGSKINTASGVMLAVNHFPVCHTDEMDTRLLFFFFFHR